MPGVGGSAAQRVPREDRVAGREHRPDLHHQAVVVGEVAHPAGVPTGAEILHEVARADDRLGLERHRGRRDPGQRVQRLGDRVHLRLVLAAGAHPLPEEGDRVEPEHLHAEVGQPQDDLGELDEHRRVGPVEVPLPLVERRPDPALELLVPREAAGREVGEDLRQRPLELVRQVAVGEDVEVVPVRRLAGPGARRPVVLARDVVEHEVHDQADALAAQRGGELAQVLGAAQLGLDRTVVADGVPAVVVALARLEQRHQVQVGDAQVLEVVEVLGHSREVTGEPVGVARVAEHPRLLQPVRGEQPLLVEALQVRGALGVRRGRGLGQSAQERLGDRRVGVDLGDRRLEVRPVPVQAQREGLPPLGTHAASPHERIESGRSFELRGRGGVDLRRCSHPGHPRIGLRLRHAPVGPRPRGGRRRDRGGGRRRGAGAGRLGRAGRERACRGTVHDHRAGVVRHPVGPGRASAVLRGGRPAPGRGRAGRRGGRVDVVAGRRHRRAGRRGGGRGARVRVPLRRCRRHGGPGVGVRSPGDHRAGRPAGAELRQGPGLRGGGRPGLRGADPGTGLHQGRRSRGRPTAGCSATPGWCARWRDRPAPNGTPPTAPDGGASACWKPWDSSDRSAAEVTTDCGLGTAGQRAFGVLPPLH